METICKYNLLKVKNGLTHFARIELSVSENPLKHYVFDHTPIDLLWGTGEVNIKLEPTWLESIILGINESLLYSNKLTNKFYTVKILHVWGTFLDTKEEDMWAAAVMATWEAIFGKSQSLEVDYQEKWIIKYPPSQNFE